jgi:hypothetical protein
MRRTETKRAVRVPGAMECYRSAPRTLPSASLDARILAAARQSAARSPDRRQLLFVGGMAATVMVAFTVRWLIQEPTLPAAQSFGLYEGHSRAYLLQFDPLTTGPGSQEGMP